MKDSARLPVIGRHTYGSPRVLWGDSALVSIGSFCSIASGVIVMAGGEHRHDWVTTFPFTHKWSQGKGIAGLPATKGNVTIGHDVWIGAGALILSGVTVGNGAVIGARAVVASDVPPYAVAVGNPARVVKMRFPENTVARLLEIAWWNWPDARIAKAVRVLSSPYVDVFIAAVDGGKL